MASVDRRCSARDRSLRAAQRSASVWLISRRYDGICPSLRRTLDGLEASVALYRRGLSRDDLDNPENILTRQAGDDIKQRANEAVSERLLGNSARDKRAMTGGDGGLAVSRSSASLGADLELSPGEIP